MRIAVCAVGRMKSGPEKELAERYFQRLSRGGGALGLDFAGVAEFAESRARQADERKRQEAAQLQGAEPSVLIVLDERGRNITSQQLAELIASHRDDGTKSLVFAIGGPDGLDESLRRRAAAVLAFGAQTWPHQLVRVMLAEQLYRATTILSGHPYHRE